MTELVRLTQEVWRCRATCDDLAERVAAVLSACPSGTVVSGMTAARLHGLWLPTEDSGQRIDVIVHPDVLVPAARANSRRAALRVHRRILLSDEVTLYNGVAVTTEARTWFDLARELPLSDLVAAGDSALRGTASAAELARIVTRARHRPGVVGARAALPLLDGRSRSRPESHLRCCLVTRGLPMPQVNVPIYDAHGGWLAEPDLTYDDVRLAIEYNGAMHADVDRQRRDMTRGLDVLGAGWRSLSVGPVQVFRRQDQLAALVRRLRADPVPVR